jgi:hypothetical protein
MSLFIAQRYATLKYIGDLLIELATHSNIVHTELMIILDGEKTTHHYSAYEGLTTPSCFVHTVNQQRTDKEWIFTRIPTNTENIKTIKNFIDHICSCRIRYGGTLCCLAPELVLEDFTAYKTDEPETWNTLFCSQSAFLVLRWCCNHKLINLPPEAKTDILNDRSFGVSPGHLSEMLAHLGLLPLNKNEKNLLHTQCNHILS